MAEFDYNVYKKFGDQLNEYYESVGIDQLEIWDIHDELDELYWNFTNDAIEDFDKAAKTIERFESYCSPIRNAFYYPISMQECLQILILIAMYPVSESAAYDDLSQTALQVVSKFHTHVNHSGE